MKDPFAVSEDRRAGLPPEIAVEQTAAVRRSSEATSQDDLSEARAVLREALVEAGREGAREAAKIAIAYADKAEKAYQDLTDGQFGSTHDWPEHKAILALAKGGSQSCSSRARGPRSG